MNRAALLNTTPVNGNAPSGRQPLFETNLAETLGAAAPTQETEQ